MRTLQLDIGEETVPYEFLGVSCSDAGHRFCWNLNRTLGFHLGFHHELEVTHKRGPETRHCVWRHEDGDEGWVCDVILNRVPDGAMVPTLVHFDYLLRIESMVEGRAEKLMASMRSLERVAACFAVDKASIAHHEVLYYE